MKWLMRLHETLLGTPPGRLLPPANPPAASLPPRLQGAVAEGGRGVSIWDTFSRTPGKTTNGETGETADDFYHRYPADIELMRRLGIRNFRLSLSWPRLFPGGTGELNQVGVGGWVGGRVGGCEWTSLLPGAGLPQLSAASTVASSRPSPHTLSPAGWRAILQRADRCSQGRLHRAIYHSLPLGPAPAAARCLWRLDQRAYAEASTRRCVCLRRRKVWRMPVGGSM